MEQSTRLRAACNDSIRRKYVSIHIEVKEHD